MVGRRSKTHMFCSRSDWLFYDVHEIWRAQLAQRLQCLSTQINCGAMVVLVQSDGRCEQASQYIQLDLHRVYSLGHGGYDHDCVEARRQSACSSSVYQCSEDTRDVYYHMDDCWCETWTSIGQQVEHLRQQQSWHIDKADTRACVIRTHPFTRVNSW